MLTMPDVFPALYMRSNLVKHSVAVLHEQVLKELCDGTHATRGAGWKCVEEHKREFDAPLSISPERLAKLAHRRARAWKDLFDKITQAAGRPPLVITYEALQMDAQAEIARMFGYVGLKNATRDSVVLQSLSNKLTSDDLRKALKNFDEHEAYLRARYPCLHQQLLDPGPTTVYWTLCLGKAERYTIPHTKK